MVLLVDERDDADKLLQYMIQTHNIEHVIVLLESRLANPNCRSVTGTTPLHLAARDGMLDLIDILYQHGASTDEKDEDKIGGNYPIHLAASNNHPECVNRLLNGGANANVKNSFGQTPLHIACRYGFTDVVETLLSKGADPNMRDSMGYPPSYWASTFDHKNIVAILPVHVPIPIAKKMETLKKSWEINGVAPKVKAVKKKGKAINCDYDLITSIDADRETYLESYRNCTVNPKQFSGKTLAFVTPWNPIGFEHAKKFEEKLDYIVPAWFTIEGIENDEHIVKGIKDMSFYNEWANSFSSVQTLIADPTTPVSTLFGAKIMPRIICKNFESLQTIRFFLNNPARFGAEMMSHVVLNGWAGITFECPPVYFPGLASELIRFVSQVSNILKKAGRTFGLVGPLMPRLQDDNFPRLEPDTWKKLALKSEFIVLMAYDIVSSGKDFGPNSPIPWIKWLMTDIVPKIDTQKQSPSRDSSSDKCGSNDDSCIVKQIEDDLFADEKHEKLSDAELIRSKILLGIPFYARLWSEQNSTPETFNALQLKKVIQQNLDGLVVWNNQFQESYFLSDKWKGPIPSGASFKIKMQLVNDEHLGGIAVWELGQAAEGWISVF